MVPNSKNGFNVIANDIQYYSYVLIKHYIENSESSLEGIVEYLNGLDGIEDFVYKNYGDTVQIDSIYFGGGTTYIIDGEILPLHDSD